MTKIDLTKDMHERVICPICGQPEDYWALDRIKLATKVENGEAFIAHEDENKLVIQSLLENDHHECIVCHYK